MVIKMRKKIIAMLALSVCMMLLLPCFANAHESGGSVFVILGNEGQTVGGVRFDFYITAKNENGEYIPCAPFAGILSDADIFDPSLSASLAGKAKVLILENDIAPYASASTDKNGTAALNGLEPGLYFVTGEDFAVGADSFSPVPFFVEVTASGSNEPSVYPKTEKHGSETTTADYPSTTEKNSTPGEELPYTGQYWSPVLLLTAAGLVLIIFGILRGRGEADA